MSLNGLDEAAVVEAYQAALAEAGGWFLLKYVSRDRVDLLGKGSGGVGEGRAMVEGYEEKSPLYGIAQYRRRKILLKYVPEGTSRLLQARLTVQFQSILEKFSPYETVFSFTTPDELTESALSTACMLHASANSLTSSSSSLRRQRLGEISEDVEESTLGRALVAIDRSTNDSASSSGPVWHDLTQQPPKNTLADLQALRKADPSLPPAPVEAQSPLPPVTPASATPETVPEAAIASFDKSLPVTPTTIITPPRPHGVKKTPIVTEAEVYEPARRDLESHRPSVERRGSSQSSRPTTRNPSHAASFSYLPYQKKKKLGPRPSLDPQGRPRTAGSQGDQRPVANLPTSIRVSIRPPSTTVSRPGSRQSSRSVPAVLVPARYEPIPPIPRTASLHISALYQPPQAEPRLPKPFLTAPNTPSITPEKQRLMKALQMRKRQMALARRRSSNLSSEAHIDPLQSLELKSKKPPRGDSTGFQDSAHHDPYPGAVHVKLAADEGRPGSADRIMSPVSFPKAPDGSSTQGSSSTEEVDNAKSDPVDGDEKSTLSPCEEDRTSAMNGAYSSKAAAVMDQTSRGRCVSYIPARAHRATTLSLQNSASNSLREHNSSSDIEKPNGGTSTKVGSGEEPRWNGISEVEVLQTFSAQANGLRHELGKPVAERPRPATPTPDPIVPGTIVEEPTPDRHAAGGMTGVDNRPEEDGLGLLSTDAKRRSRGVVDPIKTSASPDVSDVSDDDSFIEELRKAKVQEAKPISVARSPITPIFTRGSSDRLREMNRPHTASAPSQRQPDSTTSTPEKAKLGAGRSISGGVSQRQSVNGAPQALLTKKVNLASGISKRIKALEMFTARDSHPSPPQSAHSNPPSPPASKKRVSDAHLPPPNTFLATPSPRQLPSPAPTPNPEHRSSYAQQQTLATLNGATAHLSSPHRKGKSISVTARIIRNVHDRNPKTPLYLSESARMSLHRSPLTVEREVAGTPSPEPSRPTTFVEAHSQPTEIGTHPLSPSSRTSSSPIKLQASDSMMTRMSQFGSLGRNDSAGNVPRSSSDHSSLREDKGKESRTSRLMRRMSGLTAGPRRSLMAALSPSAKEEKAPSPIAEHESEVSHMGSEPSDSLFHVVDIGDVNVQFPDTLLWKRRFMRIDDQGYLILTPPTMEKNIRNVNRRFHLSDFKKPTLPDSEREEMKWSILLDFVDGSCLQCACESRYAQEQVLRMLTDAHGAYHSLYAG